MWDLPDQTPLADSKRPYWKHDPTSGRWTAPLPYDQPGREEQHEHCFKPDGCSNKKVAAVYYLQKCCIENIEKNVTHPSFVTFYFDFDSFWYAIFSSSQSFTWKYSENKSELDWIGNQYTVKSLKNVGGWTVAKARSKISIFTMFPAVTQELLLCKLQATTFLLYNFCHLHKGQCS